MRRQHNHQHNQTTTKKIKLKNIFIIFFILFRKIANMRIINSGNVEEIEEIAIYIAAMFDRDDAEAFAEEAALIYVNGWDVTEMSEDEIMHLEELL